MSSKLRTAAAAAPVWRGGVLECSGRDAAAFLQAQLMNDVRLLGDGQWQWTGWLTAKGRVQALAALLRLGAERYWLLLPDAPAAMLGEALRRYVFRSKATLEVRDELALHGGDGAPARHGSQAAGARAEGGPDGWTLDLSGATPRTLFVGRAGTAGAQAVDPDAWAVEDLAHGLPRLDPQAEPSHTPQMLGLERLAAFSVKKGCYPGQEIVARTHFLGQAKRGLQRLRASVALAPGETLHAGGEGYPVLCAASNGERHEALAVLPLERLAGPWSTGSGSAVDVIPFAEGLAR
jgi:folate-binding protein YgfZ